MRFLHSPEPISSHILIYSSYYMQYFLPNKNFPVLQTFLKPHTSALFPLQIPTSPNLCGLTCLAVNVRSPLPMVTMNQCVEGEEGLAMRGKPSGHCLRPVRSQEDLRNVHFFCNNSPISTFFHSQIPCLSTHSLSLVFLSSVFQLMITEMHYEQSGIMCWQQ